MIQHTILLFKILQDSTQVTIHKLTSCFVSGASGPPELGVGYAETKVVYVAWQTHYAFWKSAKSYRKKAVRMHGLFYIFSDKVNSK